MNAQREHVKRHRCLCAIPDPEGSYWDRCPVLVDNPDQPICDACEREHIGRHGFTIMSPLQDTR